MHSCIGYTKEPHKNQLKLNRENADKHWKKKTRWARYMNTCGMRSNHLCLICEDADCPKQEL